MKLDEGCSYSSHLGTLSAPIIPPVQCKPWTNPTMFSSLGIATTRGRIKPAHARIPRPWQHTVIRWRCKQEHGNLAPLSATHLKDLAFLDTIPLEHFPFCSPIARATIWDSTPEIQPLPALLGASTYLSKPNDSSPCFFTGKRCQQVLLSISAGKAAQKLSLNVSC